MACYLWLKFTHTQKMLRGRDTRTDVENKLMDTKGEREAGEMN